jgi:type II secretory pathway predicted ATPase ExeA
MNHTLLSPFGLKWNPFGSELPTEALYLSPKINDFFWRVENVHVPEGGFVLIHGDPGTGKSVVLRALAERLERNSELTVGVLNHPQSNLGDFYRELAEVFAVPLVSSNRWGGFKVLRERWLSHLQSTRVRCCLLIDEAQEMSPKTLLELRLLASARFDSQPLLAVVLVGNTRLTESLAPEELLPLGTRIRSRHCQDYASREELASCLDHLLKSAGGDALMSSALKRTLCERAGGNYRVMTNMAAQLLSLAVQRQITTLDEKLYLEAFAAPGPTSQAARRNARNSH